MDFGTAMIMSIWVHRATENMQSGQGVDSEELIMCWAEV